MLVLQVFIQVKPEFIEEFEAATLANARASRREPGVLRFDVIRRTNDPNLYCLYEAYRSPEAHAAHRETAHYASWKADVEKMMAVPRYAHRYQPVGEYA